MDESSPYATPQAQLDKPVTSAPLLWNPDMAGVWSFFLSPVFGSIILQKNWQAIGEPEQIESGRKCLMISLFGLLAVSVMPKYLIYVYMAYLGVWHSSCQKKQTDFIVKRWGEDYKKRSWCLPLLLGLFAFFLFLIVALVIRSLAVPYIELLLNDLSFLSRFWR